MIASPEKEYLKNYSRESFKKKGKSAMHEQPNRENCSLRQSK